jgi:AcrR family transcriptional regulator
MDSHMRARILDAGERAFCEQGFFGISIRQIAREVGVHPTLIGHYFGDKKGLLSEIELLIKSRRPNDINTPARTSVGEAPWE